MENTKLEEMVYNATLDILSVCSSKEELFTNVFEEIKNALDKIADETYNPTSVITVEQYLANAGVEQYIPEIVEE